jgi:hypothetical protein
MAEQVDRHIQNGCEPSWLADLIERFETVSQSEMRAMPCEAATIAACRRYLARPCEMATPMSQRLN